MTRAYKRPLLLAGSAVFLVAVPFVLPIGPCFYGLVDNALTESNPWPLIFVSLAGVVISLLWLAWALIRRLRGVRSVDPKPNLP